MGRFAKFIAAGAVGFAFALLSLVPDVAATVPAPVMAALQGATGAFLVWLLPNTIGGVNVADLAESMVDAWLEEDDDDAPDLDDAGDRVAMPGLGLDVMSAAVRR